jgi:hypothetical protein
MRIGTALAPALAGVALLGCLGGGPRFQTGPGAEVTYDGLHRLERTRFDRAWARPGLDLGHYQRILMDFGGIHYKRPPQRRRAGADFALEPLEREALEAELRGAFQEELFGPGGWKVAEIPGPDVLRLRLTLIDVVVDAPPEPISSRADVLIDSAGSATLVIELFDDVTGEALVRVADRADFEPSVGLMRNTAITNRTEVRRTFQAWARLARRRLDELRTLRLPESGA